MDQLTGFQRFLLAFVAFFKVWFNGAFAEAVWAAHRGKTPALPPQPEQKPLPEPKPEVKPEPAKPAVDPNAQAIHLLAILQRDGRLIDFLQEDLTGAPDAELAAVVRSTVYAGCRKALQNHIKLAPVSEKSEGDMMTVEPGFDPAAIRLTGNVVGNPPFRGTLKHKGWKIVELNLPEPPKGQGKIVAPAEVELP